MHKLDKKYVFHIPLYRFDDGELIKLPIDDLLDDLIDELGADSLYVTKAKSYYRSRCFDELLLTLFVGCDESPEEIFKNWFRDNNHIMGQEAFAYECQNKMHIFKLD